MVVVSIYWCIYDLTAIFLFIDINECASTPCQHGGACLDLINNYRCHCSSGVTGFNCETGMSNFIIFYRNLKDRM